MGDCSVVYLYVWKTTNLVRIMYTETICITILTGAMYTLFY